MEFSDYLTNEINKLSDDGLKIQIRDVDGRSTKWIGLEGISTDELLDAIQYAYEHKRGVYELN